MATLRNKRKLAGMARETQEYPRNNQSQISVAPGITEDYIAQVSEEIEGRATKKLSQDFSRTESPILGALSKLDEFVLNPLIRSFTGTFRIADVENQKPSGDRSQNDPHPEVVFSACRASNLTGSDPHEPLTVMWFLWSWKWIQKMRFMQTKNEMIRCMWNSFRYIHLENYCKNWIQTVQHLEYNRVKYRRNSLTKYDTLRWSELKWIQDIFEKGFNDFNFVWKILSYSVLLKSAGNSLNCYQNYGLEWVKTSNRRFLTNNSNNWSYSELESMPNQKVAGKLKPLELFQKERSCCV